MGIGLCRSGLDIDRFQITEWKYLESEGARGWGWYIRQSRRWSLFGLPCGNYDRFCWGAENKKTGVVFPGFAFEGARENGPFRGSGQLLVNESGELRLAHGADFGGGQLTVFEHHQRGDATNTKFGRHIAIVVNVHFGNLQFALVGCGHFVQDRGNHFARAAPFGPEVNHHGLTRLEYVGFESGVGNVFDQIAGHGLFLVNIEDAAKVTAILTESNGRACHACVVHTQKHDISFARFGFK